MARVLGVDPGSRKAGFSVLDFEKQKLHLISSGTIVLDEKLSLSLRLQQFFDDLSSLIQRHQPDQLAIEKVFFAKNAQSALVLGQARGIALLLAAQHGLDVFEYSATEVKHSICGSGRAAKDQMEHMVRILASLPSHFTFSSPDHSDAVAISLTHAQNLRSGALPA